MSTPNFYLKKATKRKNGNGKQSLIYLQIRYNNQKFVYSFGQVIDPSKWSLTRQRAKLNSEKAFGRTEHLNDLLDLIAKQVENALNSGIIEQQKLKNILDNFLSKDKKIGANGFYALVEKFVANEIKVNGKDKKIATIRSYATTYKHLKEFEHIKKYKISFETVNPDMYGQYLTYMRNRVKHAPAIKAFFGDKCREIVNLGDNAIGKDIKNIKVFMNEAVDREIISSSQFNKKKVKVLKEDSDAVYLNENELQKLYMHDLSDNKRLESVRDLFIFSCWVGLRYSDLTKITPANIVIDQDEKYIRLNMVKTGGEVIIPTEIHFIKQIFDKYKSNANSLPKFISNVKYNQYIKEACREAGLTEKNRLLKTPEVELCDAISSHTGRRSFATNLYLMGVPAIDIMKITGHKTDAMLFKYIKVEKLEAAKRLNEHYKKNSSRMSMVKTA